MSEGKVEAMAFADDHPGSSFAPQWVYMYFIRPALGGALITSSPRSGRINMLDSEYPQLDDDDGSARLSPRKQQTLTGLLGGLSEKQVAARLGISQNTVHTYVKQLYVGFRVSSRSELLALWIGGDGLGCVPPFHRVAARRTPLSKLRAERMRLAGVLARLDREVAQRQLEIARLSTSLTSSDLGCAARRPRGAEDIDFV
jgi:DNA-binding CsgD family transcriptional regulator